MARNTISSSSGGTPVLSRPPSGSAGTPVLPRPPSGGSRPSVRSGLRLIERFAPGAVPMPGVGTANPLAGNISSIFQQMDNSILSQVGRLGLAVPFEELAGDDLAAAIARQHAAMEATVDVSKQDGKMLADAPRAASQVQTAVYAAQDSGAADAVRRIVSANLAHR